MTRVSSITPESSRRMRESRPARILRSNTFAVGVSLAIHGLLLLGFYHIAFRQQNGPRRDIIPETRLLAQAGRAQQIHSEPLRLARQVQPTQLQPAAVDPRNLKLPDVKLDAAPGVSAEAALPPVSPVQPTGPADTALIESGGMRTQLFGVTGNAHRVVYVVDVSVSLSLVARQLKDELWASIQSLTPAQSFQIVLAKPYGKVEEFAKGQLVPALSSYKTKARPFIENLFAYSRPGKEDLEGTTAGGADPIRAMTRAFEARPRPELIYFLTDGSYQNLEQKLLDHLDRLNKDRDVRITVICLPGDVFNPAFLREIAKTHGGHYREVLDR